MRWHVLKPVLHQRISSPLLRDIWEGPECISSSNGECGCAVQLAFNSRSSHLPWRRCRLPQPEPSQRAQAKDLHLRTYPMALQAREIATLQALPLAYFQRVEIQTVAPGRERAIAPGGPPMRDRNAIGRCRRPQSRTRTSKA